MEKASPTDPDRMLRVSGWHAAFHSFEPERFGPSAYWLTVRGQRVVLPDAQWADWSSDGRLLVATYAGVCRCGGRMG